MEVLDSKATIKKFLDFFEEYKKKEIKKVIHQNLGYLKVSFFEISEFDYELGDKLLNHPQEVISLMEETLKQFQDDVHLKPIRVWLTSLPDSEKVMIRNVRSEHLGKLVLIEGIVRRKTDVRPRLTHIEYLCTNPSCTYSEEKLRIPQIEDKAVTLKACPKCKSGVELINKTLIDSQSLVLEELTQDLENASDQPKRLNILLQDDLVSPFKDSRTNPGSMVYVVGFVKEVPIPTRTGSESVHYDLIVDAIYIDLMEDDYSEIVISQEEEDQIKELSKKENVVEILTNNFAPAIYGYQKIKEAILLQQFGGKGASRGDGIKARGNIHILIIGDPGAAKSQMLKAATKIAPKSSFVSGKSASGAGLTATVMKDELTKGWALEAGAMVLASGGLCAIDELDKMSDEDTSSMHEALEQQTISIAKANIRATLRCETTVLGAANPLNGRFDPYGDIAKQINFPPALMSRFDLIFILRDIPDKKRDDLIANHILQVHKDVSKTIADLPSDFMKKYVAYTKRINPVLTHEAIAKIKEFYVAMRNAGNDDEAKQAKSVPITARQLEAIVRLAEAYAKVRLSQHVTPQYAQEAIDLLKYCLEKIGIDPRTGELDIDRITTGVTTSTRNMYTIVTKIIDKLEQENPEIRYDDIVAEAEANKIELNDLEKTLDKLKKDAYIYEPKKNLYKKL